MSTKKVLFMTSPTGIEFYANRQGLIFKKTKTKRIFEQVNLFSLNDGYLVVSCCGRMIPVQRIIAHLFIDKSVVIDRNLTEEERKNQVVHHINGNRSDNRVENLKVVTQKENVSEIDSSILSDRTQFKVISGDNTHIIKGGYRDLSIFLNDEYSIVKDSSTLYNNLNTLGQTLRQDDVVIEVIKKRDTKRANNKNSAKEIVFKDGDYEKTFISALDASRYFDVKPSYVYSHVLNGKNTTKIKDHNDGIFYRVMKEEE